MVEVGQDRGGGGVSQEKGRVGFRPGSTQAGHGENSKLKENMS